MSDDLTDEQLALLKRLRTRPIVFSGAESESERLMILQLYAPGFVLHRDNARQQNAMEWHITERGRDLLTPL